MHRIHTSRRMIRTDHRLKNKILTCPDCHGTRWGGLWQDPVADRVFYSGPCGTCMGTGRIRWVGANDPRAGTFGYQPGERP